MSNEKMRWAFREWQCNGNDDISLEHVFNSGYQAALAQQASEPEVSQPIYRSMDDARALALNHETPAREPLFTAFEMRHVLENASYYKTTVEQLRVKSEVSQPVGKITFFPQGYYTNWDCRFINGFDRKASGEFDIFTSPPDYEALKLRVAELEGIAIRTDAVITETTENVIQIIAERNKLQRNLTSLLNICANTGVNRQIREVISEMEQAK